MVGPSKHLCPCDISNSGEQIWSNLKLPFNFASLPPFNSTLHSFNCSIVQLYTLSIVLSFNSPLFQSFHRSTPESFNTSIIQLSTLLSRLTVMRVSRVGVGPAVDGATRVADRLGASPSGQNDQDGCYHGEHEDESGDANGNGEIALRNTDGILGILEQRLFI